MKNLNLEDYIRNSPNTILSPEEFEDRELSWLKFNQRVLYCADDDSMHPLNERMKFLAITGSNLDEFISVRFSTAYNEKDTSEYDSILNEIKEFLNRQKYVYKELRKELNKKGVNITKFSELDKNERDFASMLFMKEVFPLLTPINVGSTNEIPNLSTGQICVSATIKQGSIESLIIIALDPNIERIFRIGNKIIMCEDLVMSSLDQLFMNKEITAVGSFKVVKDANIVINHDTSKFILDRMNDTLLKRKFSKPVFMQFSSDTPKRMKSLLTGLFGVDKKHVYSNTKLLDYTRFMGYKILGDKFSDIPFEPAPYETVEEHYSIFSAISEKDILLQHPYDSFDTVVKFIEHAASDPKVLGIKQTLYRVSSSDSPIVNALCNAAKIGKHVSVLVEIKARFDESQNISLIDKLKTSGVNVLLGLEYLKTHCKCCIVARKEDDGIKIYSHVGTGNYHDKTAKIYTDISYFTAKQKIGSDLLNIFNILSGISTPDEKLQKVFYAPVNLRSKINKLIDREIDFAKKGKKAEIFLKLNSLSDIDMVSRLYKAAENGVKVYIICRGVCSIYPRENIYIKSIVGRFLEHSRIYQFRNGGNDEYFISSADFLTRNLDRRVETLISLTGSDVTDKLKYIIDVLKRDSANSFRMTQKGNFKHLRGDFDSHKWFIEASNQMPKIKIPKKKK